MPKKGLRLSGKGKVLKGNAKLPRIDTITTYGIHEEDNAINEESKQRAKKYFGNNANLLKYLSEGNDNMSLPPRPILKVTLEYNLDVLNKRIKQYFTNGNITNINYNARTLEGETSTMLQEQVFIEKNAETTLAKKDSDIPLTNTFEMLESIKAKVEKKKVKGIKRDGSI